MSTPEELLQALGRQARRLGNGGAGPQGSRVYRGRSVDELIPRIQQDLGEEAIVVRRRDGLTGGFLGFFQHAFVEIEAMPGPPRVDVYDEDQPEGLRELPAPPPSEPPAVRPAPAATPPPAAQPSPAAYQPPQPPMPAPPPAPSAPAPWAPPAARARPAPEPFRQQEPAGASAYVTAHLAALARADRSAPGLGPPRARGRQAAQPPAVDFHELIGAEPAQPAVRHEAEDFADYTPEAPPRPAQERRTVAPGSHARARQGVERSLRRSGISEELARDLMDGAAAHTLPLAPRSGLAQAVRATLAQRMPVAPPLSTTGAAIVLVGAGGSGKTTCCAALLAAYRSGSTLPASCATVTGEPGREDLRMILAPQVMKPAPAGSPRALRALRRARAEGLAVVDTPRISPSDKAGIRELALLLGEIKPERIVIALPATLGATAAGQLLTALRPLGANAMAVTHADETDQIGVAVEAACRFGLAPEYMLERSRSGGWRLRRIDTSELASKLLR